MYFIFMEQCRVALECRWLEFQANKDLSSGRSFDLYRGLMRLLSEKYELVGRFRMDDFGQNS